MDFLTQTGRRNLDRLTSFLQSRLHSGTEPGLFKVEDLHRFLTLSLSEFNQTPHFSYYSFEDTDFVTTFADILVEGAVLQALASQALLEKGREFVFTDQSVGFVPPAVSEMLQRQHDILLEHHYAKLTSIKIHIEEYVPEDECEDEEVSEGEDDCDDEDLKN